MKKIVFSILITSLVSCSSGQTKRFDILSFQAPQNFVLKEQKQRIVYELKEGNTFCQVQLWPAQQGSSDPLANFKTDWDYFVGKKYNIGNPKDQQTEKKNGWNVITGVGVAQVSGTQFIVSVSTFTKNDISWCAVTQFNDERYTADIDKLLGSIDADETKFVRKNNSPGNSTPANNNTTGNKKPVSNSFQFITTNFDDGWVSIPREDWVETTKGNIIALIHYPNKKADEYNPDGDAKLKTAWNILVAPRYSNAANMFFKDGDLFFTLPDYASAEMTDNATGKRVYVVFYKTQYYNGSGKYVEIIARSKQSFEQEFGNYETNKANKSWAELDKLQGRDKFAVAPGDLRGTWTSDFGAAINYVYAIGGGFAGMDTYNSAENFRFTGNGNYIWELDMASGMVGNIKFQHAKSSGRLTVPDNWHIKFSDISGKPRTYEAYFSCLKGGLRVLWLDGKAYAKKD